MPTQTKATSNQQTKEEVSQVREEILEEEDKEEEETTIETTRLDLRVRYVVNRATQPRFVFTGLKRILFLQVKTTITEMLPTLQLRKWLLIQIG